MEIVFETVPWSEMEASERAPLVTPPPRRRPNTWVQTCVDAWECATEAWLLEREAEAVGYTTEMAEFEAAHPRPRLQDFMVHMSKRHAAEMAVPNVA